MMPRTKHLRLKNYQSFLSFFKKKKKIYTRNNLIFVKLKVETTTVLCGALEASPVLHPKVVGDIPYQILLTVSVPT
jgi:hypothetical protein